MKVWWCEEHQSSVEDQDDPSICLLAAWVDRNWQTPCRMVEMQLVPADARIVSGATDEELYAELARREIAKAGPFSE